MAGFRQKVAELFHPVRFDEFVWFAIALIGWPLPNKESAVKEMDNPNLVYNPDFAEGIDGWSLYPQGGVQPVTFAGRTAARCDRLLHSVLAQEKPQTLTAGTYAFEYSAVTQGRNPPNSSEMVVTIRYMDGWFALHRTGKFFPAHAWGTCGVYRITLEKEAQLFGISIHAHEPPGEPIGGNVYFSGISFRKTL